jgi:hypothetical protein
MNMASVSVDQANQFGSLLRADTIKLLLEHPQHVAQFARRLDRLQFKPEQLQELRKITAAQWETLIRKADQLPAVRKARDLVVKGTDLMAAVKAAPGMEDEVKKEVDSTGIILAAVGGLLTLVCGIVAAFLGLIAGIAGVAGVAVLAAGLTLAAAIATLIAAFLGVAAGVAGLLVLISYFMPDTGVGTEIYGGAGGQPFVDEIKAVKDITRIVIRAKGYVDGFQVHYRDTAGQEKSHNWHGGKGGTEHVVQFKEGEYITSVSGRSGRYIDQLTFKTNLGTYGPFGGTGGTPFELHPVDGSDRILGFHGRAEGWLDAVGVSSRIMGGAGSLAGGAGGTLFLADLTRARRVNRVTVYHGRYIDAFKVEYVDPDGRLVETPRIGGNGGQESNMTFADDEFITEVVARYGGYIDKLVIKTNKRPQGLAFGGGGGNGEKTWTVRSNDERIVSFWGRSGAYIDALGITVLPK